MRLHGCRKAFDGSLERTRGMKTSRYMGMRRSAVGNGEVRAGLAEPKFGSEEKIIHNLAQILVEVLPEEWETATQILARYRERYPQYKVSMLLVGKALARLSYKNKAEYVYSTGGTELLSDLKSRYRRPRTPVVQ